MLFIIILSSINDTSVEPGSDTTLKSAGKIGKTPRTAAVPRNIHWQGAGRCSGLVAGPGHCHGHISFLGWDLPDTSWTLLKWIWLQPCSFWSQGGGLDHTHTCTCLRIFFLWTEISIYLSPQDSMTMGLCLLSEYPNPEPTEAPSSPKDYFPRLQLGWIWGWQMGSLWSNLPKGEMLPVGRGCPSNGEGTSPLSICPGHQGASWGGHFLSWMLFRWI